MRLWPFTIPFAVLCGLVAAYGINPSTEPAAANTNAGNPESKQLIKREAPSPGPDTPVFRFASIQRGSIEQTVTVTGALHPVKTIEVGSQLSGQLSKVYVDFNDPVRKDQPLAQIDPKTFVAKVDEAKATLEIAIANVDLEMAKLDRAKVDLENSKGNGAVLAAKLESAQAVKSSAQRTLQRKLALQAQNVVASTTVEDAQTDFTAKMSQEREAEVLMSLNGYQVQGRYRRISIARSSDPRVTVSSSVDSSTKDRRSR
jgi:HlyD family secretion protein